MWSWIACYVNGHDYSICCESGSMFLRCIRCARRSQGWVVHNHGGHSDHDPVAARHEVDAVTAARPVNANA